MPLGVRPCRVVRSTSGLAPTGDAGAKGRAHVPDDRESLVQDQPTPRVGVHLRNVQKCLTATAESHFAEENRGSSEHPDFVVRVSTASWMHFLLGKTEHVVADQ